MIDKLIAIKCMPVKCRACALNGVTDKLCLGDNNDTRQTTIIRDTELGKQQLLSIYTATCTWHNNDL